MATFVYEGMPEDEAIEMITLEEVDGGTLVKSTAVHSSLEARDQHIAQRHGGRDDRHLRPARRMAGVAADGLSAISPNPFSAARDEAR